MVRSISVVFAVVAVVAAVEYCEDNPGAVLRTATGTIKEGRGRYQNNMDCSLIIEPNAKGPDDELVLTFDKADLEKDYDWVEVYAPAGSYGNAAPVQAFSGGDFKGSKVRTKQSSMRVRFRSDNSGRKGGFVASWHLEQKQYVVCNERNSRTLTAREGRFAEATGKYPNKMHCSLTIEPENMVEGEVIHITFTRGDTEQDYDFVRIFAPAGSNTVKATKSGNFDGYSFRTSETSVRVDFTSDASTNADGYEAEYRVEQAPPTPAPTPVPTTPAPPTPAPPSSAPTPAPTAPCDAERTCHFNGYCENNVCVCFDGFTGTYCNNTVACPHRVRRSWYSLRMPHRKLFLDAVARLKDSGHYDTYANIHGSMNLNPRAHFASTFLPWHRQFLWEYESALREQGGNFTCITLPYWPWEEDATLSDQSTAEIFRATPEGFGPMSTARDCVADDYFTAHFNSVPSGGCLTRQADPTDGQFRGQLDLINLIASFPDYGTTTSDFRGALEFGGHATPHIYVGGSMGRIPTSPEDPLFFLHHCNVDRVWALWQDCWDYDQHAVMSITPQAYSPEHPMNDGLDDSLTYNVNSGSSGRFSSVTATPRDVHHVHRVGGEGYQYEDNGLLDLATSMSACNGTLQWFQWSGSATAPPTTPAPPGGSEHKAAALTISHLPKNIAARAFVENLKHQPTLTDIKKAAAIECFDLGVKPPPQWWLDQHDAPVSSSSLRVPCDLIRDP